MTINDKSTKEYFAKTLEPALDLTRLPELEALCVDDDNPEHHLKAAYGFLSESPNLASVKVMIDHIEKGVAFGKALEKFVRDYAVEHELSAISFGSGFNSAIKRTVFLGNGTMTRFVMASSLTSGLAEIMAATQAEQAREMLLDQFKGEDANPLKEIFEKLFGGSSDDKKPQH